MSIMAATRRRFVSMAFFPHGPRINKGLGAVSEGPDVAERESAAVRTEHGRVWDNDPYIDDIIALANEYFRAYEVGYVEGIVEHRSNIEHLVAFHVSVVGAIAHAAELST